MAKYIDADTVVGLMQFDDYGWTVETDTIENILDNFTEEGCPEPADVVPVVRCGKCRYCTNNWHSSVYDLCKITGRNVIDTGFCNYGEKREE